MFVSPKIPREKKGAPARWPRAGSEDRVRATRSDPWVPRLFSEAGACPAIRCQRSHQRHAEDGKIEGQKQGHRMLHNEIRVAGRAP